jgi:hypothetical protein
MFFQNCAILISASHSGNVLLLAVRPSGDELISNDSIDVQTVMRLVQRLCWLNLPGDGCGVLKPTFSSHLTMTSSSLAFSTAPAEAGVAPVRDLRLRLDSIILAQSSYSYKAHARYRYSRQHRGSWSQCRTRAHVLTGNDRTCRNHLDTSAQARKPRQNTSGLIPTRIESTPNVLPPWRRVPACLGALAIL